MGWKRATFNGKKVWVQVDTAGALSVVGGRTAMRYSASPGAKVYRAGSSRVTLEEGAAIEDLDAGVTADAAKKKKETSSGFGSAGRRTAQQASAAAASAADTLAALGEDVIVCFTDGGCRGNPGPAGSGVVVQLPSGRIGEASRSLGLGTNNVAELTAIDMALDLLDEAEISPETPVAVFSDSKYARGVLAMGWKAKKNVPLILGLRARLEKRPGVALHWIAGHAGIDGNERADALATAGVNGSTASNWR